jgi:osmotically-inducible protein OsmY
VNTYPEKLAAERAAKRVFGDRAVADDIRVRPPDVKINPEVAADVVHALEAYAGVPPGDLKATDRDGWVTLEGDVDWTHQKEAAESAVQFLGGVRGISNQIKVAAIATPAEVKERIEEALRRSAEVEADRIKVEVHGGAVTFLGVVYSWSEKEEAERVARAAPCVDTVVNHIVVAPEW